MKNADDAGVRDAAPRFDAELFQAIGDEFRCAELAIPKLGILMNVAAALDDFRLELRGGFIDAFVECGIGFDGGGHDGSDQKRLTTNPGWDNVTGLGSPNHGWLSAVG